MPKRAVITDKAAPAGGPYSHAVVAGDTVYLAGAVPMLPDGTWVTGSFAEQAHAAFRNLAAVAEAAGSSLDQAVRVGVYLRDFGDFPEMNEIYKEYIKGDDLPVRTTLPVALVGFDIEIDAILYTGA
ncbi:putative endoribonuclease L-PSP [Actinoplanes missouriensis 431]|uniref:Putative endoribonuclease L-PSP n=1 Tax=Actinoplanes missouriensis (strain ATCC 14538 / DSM 43046 / CBS 188.64 / JCM 3121 / NBRC 102363 / NCIMB 12654 / NRRL B-3342 / UNCC 431) TaxID=512565 RepID=I0HEN6_ACTM4|nr:RidA family protein [Actinoplanes missouriensis]BAL91473.1 putative endoribonuclease L-PSP [Actinoplanes missouriensis 431]